MEFAQAGAGRNLQAERLTDRHSRHRRFHFREIRLE
jgi:hypothetical protein